MTKQAKTDTEQTQLVVIEPATAITLFTEGDGIDAMLDDIRKQAASLVPDITTAKGRKEIASVAYAVAKTKTYLDGLGKDLTAQYKAIPARIDANRKVIRDTLDALKDEVRAPLTQYEEAEVARVEALQARLARLNELGSNASIEISAAALQDMLLEVEQTALDDSWQELLTQATVAKELSAKRLSETLAARQKYEAEQAELEELRKKQAEQERIDRERKIAEQATAEEAQRQEQARLDAELREREAKDREQQAIRNAEASEQARKDAENRRLQAEANAKLEAEEAATRAAEQERQRIAEEQRLKDEETARRLADRDHRGKVNSSIVMDLMGLAIDEDVAKNIVKHIANNKIAHLTINY